MRNKYLSFLAVAIIALGCTSRDEILDDFQVRVNPTFFRYVQVVNVQDLADPGAALPSDLSLEITGPNAELVYAIDGTKNFQFNDGLLQLIIPSESEPQGNAAIQYSVVVSANGYRGNSANFSISEGDFNLTSNVQILDLNSLPAGINNSTSSAGIDPNTNTLGTPLTINAGNSDSTTSVSVTIPGNVNFLDEDGNVITGKGAAGNLNVNILTLSDSTRAGQAALPGGTGVIQILADDNGGQDDTILFVATATFDIQMDLDGVPVAGFSGGKTAGSATARIDINEDLINPETGQPYQAGETVGVLEFYPEDRKWFRRGNTDVQVQANVNASPGSKFKLFIESKVYKSGLIKLWPSTGFRYPPAPRLFIFSRLANANVPVVSSGTMVMTYELPNSPVNYFLDLSGTFSSTVAGFFDNPSTSFEVPPGFNLVGITNNFGPGYTVSQINAGPGLPFPFPTASFTNVIDYTGSAVTLGYTLECEGVLISPPVGVQMLYREHTTRESTEPYKFLYQFHDPSVRSYAFTQLEDGKRYDFRAKLAQDVVDTLDVLVTDEKIYEVKLPKAICNRIGF